MIEVNPEVVDTNIYKNIGWFNIKNKTRKQTNVERLTTIPNVTSFRQIEIVVLSLSPQILFNHDRKNMVVKYILSSDSTTFFFESW